MKKKLTILFLIFFELSFSQHIMVIAGRVLDENLESLPGVQISVKGEVIGQTDLDGYYSVKVDSNTKTITYRFLGFAKTPVNLNSGCNNVEVIMRWSDDFVCIRYSPSVTRKTKNLDEIKSKNLAKEKFKNLEKLHDMAFKKGLFKTQKICGVIKFK